MLCAAILVCDQNHHTVQLKESYGIPYVTKIVRSWSHDLGELQIVGLIGRGGVHYPVVGSLTGS